MHFVFSILTGSKIKIVERSLVAEKKISEILSIITMENHYLTSSVNSQGMQR